MKKEKERAGEIPLLGKGFQNHNNRHLSNHNFSIFSLRPLLKDNEIDKSFTQFLHHDNRFSLQ